jgi:hypothetical protein
MAFATSSQFGITTVEKTLVIQCQCLQLRLISTGNDTVSEQIFFARFTGLCS